MDDNTKKGVLVGSAIGFAVASVIAVIILRRRALAAARIRTQTRAVNNKETWAMWEEDGHLKVEIHRRVENE